MRVFTILLFGGCLLSWAGCSRTPEQPPAVRDRVGEIRRYEPSMKPNPKPAAWMIGCYSIQRPEALRWATNEPMTIELTSSATRKILAQQRYEVRTNGTALNLSSWAPVSSNEMDVSLGTGMSGCVFKLSRTGTALAGTGRRWSDVPSDSPDLPVVFRRVACAPAERPN